MLVINDSTPLRIYYREVIYLPHHNRTVITTYSTYIHHTITPYMQLKVVKKLKHHRRRRRRRCRRQQLKVVKKLKDHRHPLSLAKDWTDFVLSDKSRSTHAYIIGSLDQAICIAPLDLLGAGIPTRMYESPVCRANLDSPRPKPQDYFSVRRLDDRTDGVSQYRGKTTSFQRNTLSASLYIGMT